MLRIVAGYLGSHQLALLGLHDTRPVADSATICCELLLWPSGHQACHQEADLVAIRIWLAIDHTIGSAQG